MLKVIIAAAIILIALSITGCCCCSSLGHDYSYSTVGIRARQAIALQASRPSVPAFVKTGHITALVENNPIFPLAIFFNYLVYFIAETI